ncbi:MAG TPA: hypothetical protein ENN29_02480, partial [Candidatus Hydrogenedentes bacterium]|nr:hypothetical protein [Candidatus Hydrogenedentota bacterium]
MNPLIIGLLMTVSVSNLEFYVSTGGADNNPGTKDAPFATLERARDAVREIRSGDRTSGQGVTVWLRGGDYIRTETLEFTAKDSGTPGAPVVWRAYEDETARLLGGRVINRFEHVEDAAILARLGEAARDNVLEANLRDLGVDDFGALHSRGFGRPTTPAHGELFFGGRPMTLARWPNAGDWELIAGFPEDAAADDDHGGNIGVLAEGFFYENDRPRNWRNPGGIWVHGYWAYDWANSYERVTELDLARCFIRTDEPHGLYGFRRGQRFY